MRTPCTRYVQAVRTPCAGFKDKRTEVVAELKRLQAETDPIIKIFEDQEIAESIQNTRYYFN